LHTGKNPGGSKINSTSDKVFPGNDGFWGGGREVGEGEREKERESDLLWPTFAVEDNRGGRFDGNTSQLYVSVCNMPTWDTQTEYEMISV
jgi:hypothetical protein